MNIEGKFDNKEEGKEEFDILLKGFEDAYKLQRVSVDNEYYKSKDADLQFLSKKIEDKFTSESHNLWKFLSTINNKEEFTEVLKKVVDSGAPKLYSIILDALDGDTESINKLVVTVERMRKSDKPVNENNPFLKAYSFFVQENQEINEGGRVAEGFDIKDNNMEGKDLFKSVRSFDELIQKIQEENISLSGSSQSYTPETLLEIINKIRSKELDISFITRSGGLRDKVNELLNKGSEPVNESVVDNDSLSVFEAAKEIKKIASVNDPDSIKKAISIANKVKNPNDRKLLLDEIQKNMISL